MLDRWCRFKGGVYFRGVCESRRYKLVQPWGTITVFMLIIGYFFEKRKVWHMKYAWFFETSPRPGSTKEFIQRGACVCPLFTPWMNRIVKPRIWFVSKNYALDVRPLFGGRQMSMEKKECLPRQKTRKYDPIICLETNSDHGLQEAQLCLINVIYT